MHKTTTAIWAALAAPCLMMLGGCRYDRPLWYGEQPRSAAIFCDYELRRTCATQEDIAMGIDMARPDEQGFWAGRSSTHGLDYSPAATAQCGGMPVKVQFRGPFPDGTALCFNPDRLGDFDSVEHACEASRCVGDDDCDDDPLAVPGRASHRAADGPFLNACTVAGTLRPNFKDPRRIPPPMPVTWVNGLNVEVNGNSLRKTSGTNSFDAGAAASTILPAGVDGYFEFTASEINTARTAGFAIGPLPDTNPSDADIVHAVVLQPGGMLTVTENAQVLAVTSYAPNDRIRIGAFAGVVRYIKNGQLLAIGSPVGNTALRVSVSLRTLNATITDAATTF